MWHIYTMEYYSAIKRIEIELFAVRWMDLETVIQSEVTQKEKSKDHKLTHICGTQKNGTDEPVCKAKIETKRWGEILHVKNREEMQYRQLVNLQNK